MSILIDEKTRVIVQGITGRDGAFHTQLMLQYGTMIVGGVTPGKGGTAVEGVPVFNSVLEAKSSTCANASVIYVPEKFAMDAMVESIDAGMELVVCITEGIPINQMIKVNQYLEGKHTRLIGPNCPGLISPGKSKIGIMPGQIFKRGNVGVVSKSGTLTYEVVYQLTNAGFGESTCIGIGGDPIIGTNFIDVLALFEKDPETSSIVLIGEIGGEAEEQAAEYISKFVTKKVISFIAGRTAPPEKRMGHAGAIVSNGKGTAEGKVAAFEAVGVPVAKIPSQLPDLLRCK